MKVLGLLTLLLVRWVIAYVSAFLWFINEKRREIRMVKVNVIFNDIRLLICLTPLQVNWFMLIN
jgi:hypothetical protein